MPSTPLHLETPGRVESCTSTIKYTYRGDRRFENASDFSGKTGGSKRSPIPSKRVLWFRVAYVRFIDSTLLPTFNLTGQAVTGNNFDPLRVVRTDKGETAYIRRYPLRVLRTDTTCNKAYVRGGELLAAGFETLIRPRRHLKSPLRLSQCHGCPTVFGQAMRCLHSQ